jgi:hypothetical protein
MRNDLEVSGNCRRCGGVIAYERFCAPQEHFWGWRCILCGEIVDQVILKNREWTKKGGERRKEEETEEVTFQSGVTLDDLRSGS